MKKGQNCTYRKAVFQTGLTERCGGATALDLFLTNQSKRKGLNVIRKSKSKKNKK